MGRYIGPSCKKCRRSREKLFLKGSRCLTAKCSLEKRNFPPGSSKIAHPKKLSDYGIRQREKQKLKFYYGISEVQLRNYFSRALVDKGITGHMLLMLCELRLDNVITRACLSKSRKEARLLVTQGHFLVNGKKVNIPSYLVKEGDVISINEKSKANILKNKEFFKEMLLPNWLDYNEKDQVLLIVRKPLREEIEVRVSEQMVVEFYSR